MGEMKQKYFVPIVLFVSAIAIFLAKPLFIKIVLGMSGGHGGGYAGQLSKMGIAANVAGTTYIIAALLAVAGGVLLVRAFYKK